jgi:hypothetical protein
MQDFHQEWIYLKFYSLRVVVLKVFDRPFILLSAVVDELLGNRVKVEKKLVLDHAGCDFIVHALEKDLNGVGQLKIRKLDGILLSLGHLLRVELLHLIGVLA